MIPRFAFDEDRNRAQGVEVGRARAAEFSDGGAVLQLHVGVEEGLQRGADAVHDDIAIEGAVVAHLAISADEELIAPEVAHRGAVMVETVVVAVLGDRPPGPHTLVARQEIVAFPRSVGNRRERSQLHPPRRIARTAALGDHVLHPLIGEIR
jgi:hypothetical protein